jgi:hypothetical protein
VFGQPVRVIDDPETGSPIVLPRSGGDRSSGDALQRAVGRS